jgi:hypothetical protein
MRVQGRIWENMKGLKGSAAAKQLLGRCVRELNEQEDRLGALRRRLVILRAQRDRAAAEQDCTIEAVI